MIFWGKDTETVILQEDVSTANILQQFPNVIPETTVYI